jgi:hypothetical protein
MFLGLTYEKINFGAVPAGLPRFLADVGLVGTLAVGKGGVGWSENADRLDTNWNGP